MNTGHYSKTALSAARIALLAGVSAAAFSLGLGLAHAQTVHVDGVKPGDLLLVDKFGNLGRWGDSTGTATGLTFNGAGPKSVTVNGNSGIGLTGGVGVTLDGGSLTTTDGTNTAIVTPTVNGVIAADGTRAGAGIYSGSAGLATLNGSTMTFGVNGATGEARFASGATEIDSLGRLKIMDSSGVTVASAGTILAYDFVGHEATYSAGGISMTKTGNPTFSVDADSGDTAVGGTLDVTGATSTNGITNTGDITNTGHISTATLSTTGDATVGGKLSVTGDAAVGGTLTVTGAASTNGITNTGDISTDTLAVNSTSTFGDTAIFNAGGTSTTITGGLVTISNGAGDTTAINGGFVTVDKDLAVKGQSTFGSAANTTIGADGSVTIGTIAANAPLAVNGTSTLNGNTTVNGNTTLNGDLSVAPGGNIDMGDNVVHGVATPIVGTDAANKAYVDRGVGKANEGTALALAISQPMFLPGQNFAMRAGWGEYEGQNAFGASAAGVVAYDVFGQGSTLTLDGGVGIGSRYNGVAGKAGLTFGFGGPTALK